MADHRVTGQPGGVQVVRLTGALSNPEEQRIPRRTKALDEMMTFRRKGNACSAESILHKGLMPSVISELETQSFRPVALFRWRLLRSAGRLRRRYNPRFSTASLPHMHRSGSCADNGCMSA